MSSDTQLDAFPPAKLLSRMEETGAARAELGARALFALALLAGVFISLGALFSTAMTTGLAEAGMGAGLVGVLGGLAFCLGLIAVVVAGAELFAANNLVVMAAAGRRLPLLRLLRFWGIVYAGNLVGALLMATVLFLTRQFTFSGGLLGANALAIGAAKTDLGILQAFALGLMGSVLICLAVWLCSSARSTTDKILAVIFPITAFVAAGFEHAIANAYLVPLALLVKAWAPDAFWAAIGRTVADYPGLSWGAFLLKNLLPVSVGNILGGAGFVALTYWLIYLRPRKVVSVKAVKKEARAPHILVVDDDPDFVEVTSMILDRDGYELSTAANGRQAWDAMMTKKPDMVLLDVMMSTTLEGVDLARRMAADPKLKDVPIIMISSIDSTYHAGKLPDNIHIPIDAWLSKPVNPELLLKTVKRFLR